MAENPAKRGGGPALPAGMDGDRGITSVRVATDKKTAPSSELLPIPADRIGTLKFTPSIQGQTWHTHFHNDGRGSTKHQHPVTEKKHKHVTLRAVETPFIAQLYKVTNP